MAASNINIVAMAQISPATQSYAQRRAGPGLAYRVAVNSRLQGRLDRRVGRQPHFLTSQSGARRARTAPTPLEGPAGGRRRPPRLARMGGAGWLQRQQWRSSPTVFSSSAPALTTRAEAVAATASSPSPTSLDTSDFEGATASSGSGSDDDIPLLATIRALRSATATRRRAGRTQARGLTDRGRPRKYADQRRSHRRQGPEPVAAVPLRPGQDRSRRVTGLSRKHQQQLALAVGRHASSPRIRRQR